MKKKFEFFNELKDKEPRFDSVHDWDDENEVPVFFCRNKREKIVVYANGNQKPLPDACEGHCFFSGLTKIKVDGKYGFIDLKGNVVVTPLFDEVSYFKNKLCAVRVGEKWGFINKKGKMVIDPRFEEEAAFSKRKCAVKENGLYGIIDKKGRYVIKPIFDNCFYSDPFWIVTIGDKCDIVRR